MFREIFTGLFISLLFAAPPSAGQEPARETLYKVSTLRAAPGELLTVIELLKAHEEAGFYEAAGDHPPYIMRHSQGDQWDLMLVQPIGTYAEYYDEDRIRRRARNSAAEEGFRAALEERLSFREDLFARGPSLEIVSPAFEENDFYHIEMFHALAGETENLIQEREMENRYLEAIGNEPNLIWVRDQGSDVDVFTIGFYASLQEYAAPPALADEQMEAAAIEAGFEGRAFIGSYLREFLLSHHDTLAVSVD